MTDETISTLDSILNDDPKETETVEQEQEAEPAAKEPEPKEVKGEEEGETPLPKEGHVPVKAVLEERRKRQAAEDELAAYRAKEAQKPTRPDALEDPEGALKHTETEIEKRFTDIKINTSRNIMLTAKTVFPDYEEKEQVFVKLATENPQLVAEMHASENPAMYAYNKANEHLQHQEYLKVKDTEFKEFLEAKKLGTNPETPEAKRNKSALTVPNLINTTSSGKVNPPVKKVTLDELMPT